MIAKLPILEHSEEILRALSKSRKIIISSPPGSGKSTLVPQIIKDSKLVSGKVVVLEPRRLAAIMLAGYVAKQRKTVLGKETGYRVRFDDCTSKDVNIIFETEGILLRELISDYKLQKYGAVIFDEFHERHLYSDTALAICLDIQKRFRPDLLIIVMSATLDTEKINDYLQPCEKIISDGKTYPVKINYCNEESAKLPIWQTAARGAAEITETTSGNTLIFMPGVYEINKTISELEKCSSLKDFKIFPLYGSLKPNQQNNAVTQISSRKIIVATNIAETSITIDNTDLVIDSGLANVASYDSKRAVNTLFTQRITKSSADQRAGRAGRTCSGICVRLWTEKENNVLQNSIEPEIKRLDLSEALLMIKSCGYKDFDSLSWTDKPKTNSVKKAKELLRELKALNDDETLTEIGKKMSGFSVHPRYARMLIEAETLNCSAECALAAAGAQGKSIWNKRKRENDFHSDFYFCIKSLTEAAESNFNYAVCDRLGINQSASQEAFKTAKKIFNGNARQQYLLSAEKIAELTAKCFITAFPDRIASLLPDSDKRYSMPGQRRAYVDKDSAAYGSKIIVSCSATEMPSANGTDITLSFAAEVKLQWLKDIFPNDIRVEKKQSLDKNMLTPVTEINTYYRDIIVNTEYIHEHRGKMSSEIIARQFIDGIEKFTHWNEETEAWLNRMEFLAKACPDFGIKPLSDEDLELIIYDICDGAKSVSDAKSRPVLEHIKNWYGWDICRLIDKHAPDKLLMPNNRRAKIKYPKNGEPFLEAKIQDLYTFQETPLIAAERVRLVVHILAPSMRPVQVTKDLKSFWSDSYPKIKPALARRYPKHKWI